MTAGGIRRRCRCRDEQGKDLGSKCPKLAQRSHGTWQLRQELPSADGKRKIFRRTGYATRKSAQADLDRVRELVALAEDDTDQDEVTTLLLGLKSKDPLPDAKTVRRQLRSGQAVGGKLTVGEWLDRWLAQETHRRATYISYESHIRLYLKPKIGDVRLDRLTVNHLTEMFNEIEDDNDTTVANNSDRHALEAELKETSVRVERRSLREQLDELPPHRRPVGKSSQQRIKATLRAALNDAIAQQLTTFNPAAHVEIKASKTRPLVWTRERVAEWQRTGHRPGPVMVWTPQQAGAFLDYVAEHEPGQEPLWHLALYRGPRRGELAGLAWTEVDFEPGTIEIRNQITEVEYALEEGAPKSDAGQRTIPLDDEAVRLLREHRKQQMSERLRLGPAWVESGMVFTAPDGSALRPSWIGDQFERLYTAAGLPPLRLHDARHVAATLMLAARVDMKVVQETLGHSALATTSDLYTSVLPEIAQAAAEATVAVVPRAPRGRPSATRETLGHPSGTHSPVDESSTRGGDRQSIEKPQVNLGISGV